MFDWGTFNSHSGVRLPFKINCDCLSLADWDCFAKIVAAKFSFSSVVGVPTGGLNFAAALKPFRAEGYPTLIVDDVLTTGQSMEEQRKLVEGPSFGIVVFSRGPTPRWIWPIMKFSSHM